MDCVYQSLMSLQKDKEESGEEKCLANIFGSLGLIFTVAEYIDSETRFRMTDEQDDGVL